MLTPLFAKIECMDNILECLIVSLKHMTNLSATQDSGSDNDNEIFQDDVNEDFQSSLLQQSIKQSIECFSLATVLLERFLAL